MNIKEYLQSIDPRRVAVGFAIVVVACVVSSAVFVWRSHANPPNIPFAPMQDTSIKDPDNPIKIFRVDFAKVEEEFPLSPADFAEITPRNIVELPEEKIDQIYGRITAGPIPDGAYEGNVFVARDGNLKNRFEGLIGGIEGRLSATGIDLLEKISRVVWKGKQFDAKGRIVENFIEDSVFFRGLVDNPSTLRTSRIPRHGFLGLIWPTNQVWLLFPGKMYCGQSLLDSRRESIVLDYNYADDIADYRQNPDSLSARNGLKFREEMRMVRPGFYLGRTYSNRMFVAYFTLYKPEIAEAKEASAENREDCWVGEQVRKAAKK